MIVAPIADIPSRDHNILGSQKSVTTRHWLYEMGWHDLFSKDCFGLEYGGLIQCVGSKRPRMVDGEVIIERCGRTLPIPDSWSVAVTRHWAPLFMLCYQHADQRADFTAMYDRLSAEA